MKQRILLFLLSSLLLVTTAPAGNTGKIAGTVTDAQTGEAVIGANILLEGTSQGAATNIDGYYVILNIPPGKYNLAASGVGYSKKSITGVQVSIDLTSTIDFTLASTVLDVGEEITVTASRPLVTRDLTAKTAVVNSEQISALPVTEVGQILSLQAGFVSGSLRGGRSGEVAYWIDGVPVTDVYDGKQVVEVNKNLVQELQLVSGAFNAEYGQAMSGIVNIATKEGGQKFAGTAGVYVGDYMSSHTDIYPGIDDRSLTNIRNYEGSLSGPLLGQDLTFFANGRYIYFNGDRKGVRRYNPQNLPVADPSAPYGVRLIRDPKGQGDGAIVPMNWSERKYGQGKLTWHVSPVIKASLNYIYDNNPAKLFDEFTDRREYFYNPDGFGTNYNLSKTAIFQFSHTLSGRTFYTIGGSYFDKDSKYYLYEDPHDPRYVHPDLFQKVDVYSFFTGGTDLHRFHRSTKTLLGKIDVSSQIGETNLVKVGAEFRRHKLFYESYDLQPIQSQKAFNRNTGNPFIQTEIPPLSSISFNTYTHRPVELSAYVQDKLEFKDFILNIGVRFDYFQPDGVVLNDETDPNIYDPLKPNNRFFDQNGNGKQDAGELTKTVDDRRAYWYKKASTKAQLSPRLGASFPITARGVVHFSYGHFFQIPRFERLYENPDFKFGSGTGNLGTAGNSDLKPEQTINGEIGIQQQIADDISVDLTAYLRDIRNLTATGADEIVTFTGAKYSKYQNRDFGTIKGIVLTVDKRFSGGFSATLDYTFQVARGSGSNPADARDAVTGGRLPDIQLTPLGWDQRHTLNATVAYDAKNWGVSFISQYGSGTPYTPRASTDVSTLLTNSQGKPSFYNLDARAFYEFAIEPLKLVAFLRVFNLFDIKNETGVWDDSGRAGYTADEQNARNSNSLQLVNTLEDWFRRSTFYSEPRRVELGLNLEF